MGREKASLNAAATDRPPAEPASSSGLNPQLDTSEGIMHGRIAEERVQGGMLGDGMRSCSAEIPCIDDLMAGQTDPLAAQSDLTDSEIDPLNSQTDPLAVQSDLLNGQTYPLDGQSDLLSSVTDPLNSLTDPLDYQTASRNSQTYPLDGQTNPLDSQTYPLTAQIGILSSETDPQASQTPSPAPQNPPHLDTFVTAWTHTLNINPEGFNLNFEGLNPEDPSSARAGHAHALPDGGGGGDNVSSRPTSGASDADGGDGDPNGADEGDGYASVCNKMSEAMPCASQADTADTHSGHAGGPAVFHSGHACGLAVTQSESAGSPHTDGPADDHPLSPLSGPADNLSWPPGSPHTDDAEDDHPFSPMSQTHSPPAPLDLDGSVTEEALRKLHLQQQVVERRFCVRDITHNEELAEAARRELAGVAVAMAAVPQLASVNRPASETAAHVTEAAAGREAVEGSADPSWCMVQKESVAATPPLEEVLKEHEEELFRQGSAVAAIERDVGQESSVIREAVQLVVDRLDASRRALEGLMKLLQALAAAESVYAAAMLTASKLSASEQGEDNNMQEAISMLGRLPSVVSQSHRCLHTLLTSQALECSQLLKTYRSALGEVSSEAAKLRRQVETGRTALSAAYREHAAACRSLEIVMADRAGGRASGGPQLDPWSTEGKLVQCHKTFLASLLTERTFLSRSFQHAKELELQKLELGKKVSSVGADSYLAAMMPVQQDLAAISTMAHGLDTRSRLATLTGSAASACNTVQSLASGQASDIEGLCQESLCSSEIIRQAGMQYWNNKGNAVMSAFTTGAAAAWLDAHFVLTRAGFLYWFKSMEDTVPQGVLSLARCEFEAGAPPVFNIVQDASIANGSWLGGVLQRKISFQAPDVEECCEWALAIREAIAVARGRALAFEDS